MPTIDQLAPAVAASDTDEMPVNQNGVTRKLTRAQLLSGIQPQLALAPGSLLGAPVAGAGTPEQIIVGANLSLSGNTLSATAAPFSVLALPPAQVPSATDKVPLGQAGGNAAIAYAQFMAGLSNLSGLDLSTLEATATGTPTPRALASLFADAVAVESFGAVGDGVTDDTAAFTAAVASGRSLHLGPKTYVVNGQWTVPTAANLIGVRGQTIVQRHTQTGNGAWIAVSGASFRASGIIFDANNAIVTQTSWGLLVAPGCTVTEFVGCSFANAAGAVLGCGLTIQASDPAITQHVIRDCEAYGNAADGIWVQAVDGVQIIDCRAHDNAVYGICVDYNDQTFVQKARKVQICGNECWNNNQGIAVGNFNATNTLIPVWGNANPDVISVLVAANNCHDNNGCGIGVSGRAISVEGNLITNNGIGSSSGTGILANMSYSRVAANMITGASQFGIDAGGSINSDIIHNYICSAIVGINPGGSQNMRVAHNYLQDCTSWAVTVNNVESSGSAGSFNLATLNMALTDNWISFSTAGAGGIFLLDAPQQMLVARNAFFGGGTAQIANALWAHTDSVIIEGNRWNNTQRFICNPQPVGALQQVQFPDIIDDFMITYAPSGVQSMQSLHQVASLGQITYIKVTNGGSGYTQATIAVSGSGSGCTAVANITNGVIIGIAVTSPGGGYGGIGATATVTITGDGTGATAQASVGLPVLEERRLRVECNSAVLFSRSSSQPLQDNWTLFDFTAPANSAVEWIGTYGSWRAVQFPPGDYLNFTGDGTLILRSAGSADLILKPAPGGHVRLCSQTEGYGAMTLIGRGSPLGVVVAPPGSDYRNLNGGAGATFWIKASGQDASGWVAVA